MLVAIQHMTKSSGTWGANQNLVFTDDGGTSTLTLRIDGDTNIDENTEPSWPKDIVGIIGQYDNSTPFDAGYQTLPRAFADFHADGALPVELTSLTATTVNDAVMLNWRTATEINNYGFEIQRLQDGKIEKLQDWVKIGFVEGHGNSNSPKEYLYNDTDKLSGLFNID